MTRLSSVVTAVAVVLLALPGAVSGQATSRVGPALRYLMRLGAAAVPPTSEARMEAKPATPGELWPRGAMGPTAALEATPTGILVHTLVRLGPGGEQALRAAGASIGTRAGDIVTARIPLAALPRLAAAPQLRYLEAAMPLTATAVPPGPVPYGSRAVAAAAMPNNVTRSEIRVNELWRRVGDHFVGIAGQGVIVGVVDDGLDLKHGDFLDPAGKTRVIAAWDQVADSAKPPGVIGGDNFMYGHVCTADDIDGGNCPMDDSIGHGTHVTGTAAGDGSATGNGQPAYRFTGVAPGAGLIIVKSGELGFTSDMVVDGVAYIFAMAQKLGRPAVVNLSLSSQQGPHDGTTLFEQALDNLSGPGHIVVAAAGNEGANDNETPKVGIGPQHAMGVADGPPDTLLVPQYTPRPGPQNDAVQLELWYSGADSLAVTVVSPSGIQLSAACGDTAFVGSRDGAIGIDNASQGRDPNNGDRVAFIAVGDLFAPAAPAAGRWLIRVHGDGLAPGSTGPYHVWLSFPGLPIPPGRVQFAGGSNAYVVGAPATADRVIAVAAYAARHEWTTLGGQRASFPYQEPLGDIAFFSSPGPRRDGVLKPDVAAPGEVVISSLARHATLWTQDLKFLIEADSVHAGSYGTSMAAPAVTGTVALLLQLQPDLTPEAARELLVRSARQDQFTPHPYTGQPNAVPNAQWGYGKVDAAAAAARLRPQGLPPAGEQVNLSENPVRSDALIITYGEQPKSIAIYSLTGRRVRVFGAGEIGPLSTVWPLDNERGATVVNGPYLVVLDFAHSRVIKKVFVVRK
ncbi:MAG: S8 family serine peptidase [Gemmatimonadota bacterium]